MGKGTQRDGRLSVGGSVLGQTKILYTEKTRGRVSDNIIVSFCLTADVSDSKKVRIYPNSVRFVEYV